MPPWPGGPCPECGEVMPERIIHCRNCRKLRVNKKFIGKRVTCKQCSGDFVLDFTDSKRKIEKNGIYVYCPHCSDRLRMSTKYLGVKVACKSCTDRLMAVE